MASPLRNYVADAVDYALGIYVTDVVISRDFDGDNDIDVYDALILASHPGMQDNNQMWDLKIDLARANYR